jgi:hypothetical protein
MISTGVSVCEQVEQYSAVQFIPNCGFFPTLVISGIETYDESVVI